MKKLLLVLYIFAIKSRGSTPVNFTVFPNPANSSIQIRCQKEISSVEILDVLGRTIKRSSTVNDYETQIDVQDLPRGVYFVNVSGSDYSGTKKLIKN